MDFESDLVYGCKPSSADGCKPSSAESDLVYGCKPSSAESDLVYSCKPHTTLISPTLLVKYPINPHLAATRLPIETQETRRRRQKRCLWETMRGKKQTPQTNNQDTCQHAGRPRPRFKRRKGFILCPQGCHQFYFSLYHFFYLTKNKAIPFLFVKKSW